MNEKISFLEKAGKQNERLGSWRFSATEGTLVMMGPKLEEAYKYVQAAKKPVRPSAVAGLEVAVRSPPPQPRKNRFLSPVSPILLALLNKRLDRQMRRNHPKLLHQLENQNSRPKKTKLSMLSRNNATLLHELELQNQMPVMTNPRQRMKRTMS